MPDANFLQLDNLATILFVAVAVGLFYVMYRSNKRIADKVSGPKRSVAYECVTTAASKAKPDLIKNFPQLDDLPSRDDISLVRFGIFNWGELALDPENIVEDIAVEFENGNEVLSASLGEMIKTETEPDEAPRIDGTKVTFPPFPIAARGTVIFDVMLRGNGKPETVSGFIDGVGPIRRLG